MAGVRWNRFLVSALLLGLWCVLTAQAQGSPRLTYPSSVVQLFVTFPDGTQVTGSASLVNASGIFLTNAHVVASNGQLPVEIQVLVTNGKGELPQPSYLAGVLSNGLDSNLDLAVLSLTSEITPAGTLAPVQLPLPMSPLVLGDSNALDLGDPLFIVGYPAGSVALTLTTGTVSSFDPDGFIVSDARIASGNSGGAALNARGELIGVPTLALNVGRGGEGPVETQGLA
ncbi:MAG: trypsin-like peptidase domain-containing protein, partial [Deinococcus sp.]|nr:trypsin-like peptidase domain-containing protein [Deinococcus sp.]